jgi:DNA-binding response OmpR family regulator
MAKENKKRLMLVEDNEDFGGVLCDLLKKQGFEVIYFVDAAEALNYPENGHHIDIALVDLMDDLSDSVSGLDVAKKVRENNSGAKIFIMSGIELEALSIVNHLIEKKELQGYLKKPFNFADLKELIT